MKNKGILDLKTKIVFLFLLVLSGCSKKEDSACTTQDYNSSNVIVSCINRKSDGGFKYNVNNQEVDCTTITGSSTALCYVGFMNNCSPLKLDPDQTRSRIAETVTNPSQQIHLINKANGKELVFKQVTDSNGTYLIIKHLDDPGETSSISLPSCSY